VDKIVFLGTGVDVGFFLEIAFRAGHSGLLRGVAFRILLDRLITV